MPFVLAGRLCVNGPFGWETEISMSNLLQESGKLTKAQRKNLKRTEKKAAERSTEKLSVASSELISEADLANIEFDAIPAIEEESIFTSLHDDCMQVSEKRNRNTGLHPSLPTFFLLYIG